MTNRHIKSCSTLLAIKEMLIKITMRYHLIPVRKAISPKSTNIKYWQGGGENGTPVHCW